MVAHTQTRNPDVYYGMLPRTARLSAPTWNDDWEDDEELFPKKQRPEVSLALFAGEA